MLNFSRAQEFLGGDFKLCGASPNWEADFHEQFSWIKNMLEHFTQKNCIMFHRLSGQDVIWLVFN